MGTASRAELLERISSLEYWHYPFELGDGVVIRPEHAAEKLKLRMLEVPIYFADRHVGKSKMTPLVKIEAALRVFEIRWRNRKLGVYGIKPSYGNRAPNLAKRKDSALPHI